MPIDMSAAKAPPKRPTTAAKKATAATPPPAQETPKGPSQLNQDRYEGLLGLAQLGQGICLMAGLHADAMTIGRLFPPVAKEIANIADDNETIAQPLDFIIKIGPYGALIAAGMPFVMQILANHKVIDPAKAIGQVVAPEVLEAQMKADIMRAQAEAMQMQQQAIREANEAAAAYAKMMETDAPAEPAMT